ncbi:hypothetical protein R1sor_009734 [Riccia sorocarpa]|uniref:Uncharacterized protein n=1 Tax=Riccia sorocarpa TaxID=122646 RepID=A0ABD3HVY1_9MARC
MDAFASTSPDEIPFSIESALDSDAEEEEEFKHEYIWTMELKMPDTPESAPEANCLILEPAHQIHMDDVNEATCSGFSSDNNWCAVGTRNGPIQIYNMSDGRKAFTLDVLKGGLKRWPCTALCIRPSNPGDSSYNVLLSCGMFCILRGNITFQYL